MLPSEFFSIKVKAEKKKIEQDHSYSYKGIILLECLTSMAEKIDKNLTETATTGSRNLKGTCYDWKSYLTLFMVDLLALGEKVVW